MFKTIVDELIAIKKELQDIKLILKFHFLSNYKTERVKMDGETIINRYILPDPLEELRKEEHILQQSRLNEMCIRDSIWRIKKASEIHGALRSGWNG